MSICLQRNLQALALRNAPAAEQLRAGAAGAGLTAEAGSSDTDAACDASASIDLHFEPTRQPPAETASLTAAVAGSASPITLTLASRYRPLDEAAKLADTANLDEHAAIIVLGFGLGYHVAELARRTAGKAALIIFEPDPKLLAAVLARIDHSGVLAQPHVTLIAGPVEDAELTRRLEPLAGIITQGVQFISHAPTRRLHDEAIKHFAEQFARTVAYLRTTMATTLVNAAVTCRNLTHNIARYAAGPTVNELAGAAAGYPAVLVSAGPSLAKNVELLTQPGMRDRVVIIAVQTVLKPLLARGIRPHFVTALDYHEISARFYENLPALPDVTLVAEPKAHRSVVEAFPGPVRMLHNKFLDRVLGPLRRPITPMQPGSTVAHLSLYLAQHLGCDPIIMIGQDLGFSDGLYYCPGTAIHDVWAGELSAFNTLEMMEWQRVARHKAHLKKRVDIHDRPIYSDEQMLTYLAQFERDFAQAPQKIIDATEGGLPKQHTRQSTLEAALADHARRDLPDLPPADQSLDADRLRRVGDLLRERIDQVQEFRQVSRDTLPILRNMQRDQRDHTKMNRHFEKLEANKRRVAELNDAFSLVNDLNQIGLFKRVRADRAIEVGGDADPYERQLRQLDRDIENIDWIIQSCDETLTIFNQALDHVTAHLRDATVESRGAA